MGECTSVKENGKEHGARLCHHGCLEFFTVPRQVGLGARYRKELDKTTTKTAQSWMSQRNVFVVILYPSCTAATAPACRPTKHALRQLHHASSCRRILAHAACMVPGSLVSRVALSRSRTQRPAQTVPLLLLLFLPFATGPTAAAARPTDPSKSVVLIR